MAGDEVAAIYFVLLAVVRRQVDALAEQVAAGFGRHPDIEIHLSQPGEIHGARALAEFGDDPQRYADARPGRTTS